MTIKSMLVQHQPIAREHRDPSSRSYHAKQYSSRPRSTKIIHVQVRPMNGNRMDNATSFNHPDKKPLDTSLQVSSETAIHMNSQWTIQDENNRILPQSFPSTSPKLVNKNSTTDNTFHQLNSSCAANMAERNSSEMNYSAINSRSRYNKQDFKTITDNKNKNKWWQLKCGSHLCGCHPCLCCFLITLGLILLLFGILAIVLSVVGQRQKTSISSTTETMATMISTRTITSTTITTTTATTSTWTTTSTATTTTSTSTTTSTTITTTSTTTTTAPRIFLINPGAENGTLMGWTPIGTSPSVDNGTANLGSTPPYAGSFDFYGGPGQSLYQTVSLTSMFSSVHLDNSSLFASYSFRQRSANQTPPDTAQVTLVFRSSTNTVISNITSGPSACILVWCYLSGNISLPVGTRSIDYVMKFVANYGSYADAWIDDNMLNVF